MFRAAEPCGRDVRLLHTAHLPAVIEVRWSTNYAIMRRLDHEVDCQAPVGF